MSIIGGKGQREKLCPALYHISGRLRRHKAVLRSRKHRVVRIKDIGMLVKEYAHMLSLTFYQQNADRVGAFFRLTL